MSIDIFSQGAVKSITMITLTMCDINSDVIWNFSSPVKIHTYITQEGMKLCIGVYLLSLLEMLIITHCFIVNFDCAGNSYKIEYSDDTGTIVLHLGASEDSFILQKILIFIKVNVINHWFGTRH